VSFIKCAQAEWVHSQKDSKGLSEMTVISPVLTYVTPTVRTLTKREDRPYVARFDATARAKSEGRRGGDLYY